MFEKVLLCGKEFCPAGQTDGPGCDASPTCQFWSLGFILAHARTLQAYAMPPLLQSYQESRCFRDTHALPFGHQAVQTMDPKALEFSQEYHSAEGKG